MRLTEHFTLEELCATTHKSLRAANVPTITHKFNLLMLCVWVLEPLRAALRKPLIINSGYRCPELNKAVGGARFSYHMQGLAADIHCSSQQDAEDIMDAALSIAAVDKLIIEARKQRSLWWVHIQTSISTTPRREFLTDIK